jgi:hypothetical protein
VRRGSAAGRGLSIPFGNEAWEIPRSSGEAEPGRCLLAECGLADAVNCRPMKDNRFPLSLVRPAGYDYVPKKLDVHPKHETSLYLHRGIGGSRRAYASSDLRVVVCRKADVLPTCATAVRACNRGGRLVWWMSSAEPERSGHASNNGRSTFSGIEPQIGAAISAGITCRTSGPRAYSTGIRTRWIVPDRLHDQQRRLSRTSAGRNFRDTCRGLLEDAGPVSCLDQRLRVIRWALALATPTSARRCRPGSCPATRSRRGPCGWRRSRCRTRSRSSCSLPR